MSFEYPGPSPSLKGAGDNDLPVKGVVDLEFKVGKTKISLNDLAEAIRRWTEKKR